MKYLLLSLIILISISAHAASTVEAYHIPSEKDFGYPELLIRVLDDGTCSSEVNNFDGTKDILITACSVSEFKWVTMETLKITQCEGEIHQDIIDATETASVVRSEDGIEMDGIYFNNASAEILDKFEEMDICESEKK